MAVTITAMAQSVKGTTCSRRFLVCAAGIVHRFLSKSNSFHSANASSPRRRIVSIRIMSTWARLPQIRVPVPSHLNRNSQAFEPLVATRNTRPAAAGSEMSQTDAPELQGIYICRGELPGTGFYGHVVDTPCAIACKLMRRSATSEQPSGSKGLSQRSRMTVASEPIKQGFFLSRTVAANRTLLRDCRDFPH